MPRHGDESSVIEKIEGLLKGYGYKVIFFVKSLL